MNEQLQIQQKAASVPTASSALVRNALLQCKCAGDGIPDPTGMCAACRKKREAATLQRAAVSAGPINGAPPIVHEAPRSPAQPLDAATLGFMEPCFGNDLAVRVRMDAHAEYGGLRS